MTDVAATVRAYICVNGESLGHYSFVSIENAPQRVRLRIRLHLGTGVTDEQVLDVSAEDLRVAVDVALRGGKR
jgi:hypothetical protein